jgi:hypothetical protein
MAKFSVSADDPDDIANLVPGNGFARAINLAACSRCRGASRVSSLIILDCCAELISSSKTNKNIVQRASMVIPTTTSINATQWVDGGYFGPSNIIPAPTAILASTLNDNKETCGQKGSAVPDRTLLKYVSIAAIMGWLIVSIIAITQLVEITISICGVA